MRIGNVEIPSRLALAPMAGVTDAAFRQICAEMGAGLTCTELISSKALCYHDKKNIYPAAAVSRRASRRGADFWQRSSLYGGGRPDRFGGHRCGPH